MPYRRPAPVRCLSPGRIALIYAAFAALWIAVSDSLLGMLIRDPALSLQISAGKGFLFVAVTAALLLLLLRCQGQTAAEIAPGADNAQDHARPSRMRMPLVFGALAMVVPLIGLGIIHLHGPHMQQAAFADLRAIAGLKAGQMEFWLNERRGDAEMMASSPGFIDNVDAMLRGDQDARQHVLTRIERLRHIFGYETDIYDDTGRKVYSSFIHNDPSGTMLDAHLADALRSGQVQNRDIYRDARGHVHLEFIVPLLLDTGAAGRVAIGNLVLHAPVERFLYPLVDTWPTPSASAETLLVRRDGDKLRLLSEFHHNHAIQSDQAPLEIELAGVDVPEQTAETRDYRGTTVLAAIRPVIGTPWHILAKIDRDEVMAPLRDLVFWVSIVAFFAIACLAAAVFMLWRQQAHAHAMELRAQAAEKDRVLRHFYDLSLIGMAITSPLTKQTLHVNDELCRITGYTRDEMLRLPWPELIHPERRSVDLAEYALLLSGEIAIYARDSRLIRKDGSVIDITVNSQCVRRPDGQPELTIATIQDVTARKNMEHALRESESNLNHAQRIARMGSWALDVRRNELIWSAETHRIFDIPVGTPLTYELFLNRVHPEDRDQVDRAWKSALQGEPYDIEHRIIAADGIKWIRERAELNFAADGQLIGGLGTSQDITERKEIELRLLKSEEIRRQSQRIAALGHYVFDIAAGTWTSSDTLDEIFGIDASYPKEVENWLMLIHPEERDEMQDYLLDHVLRDRKPFDREYRIVRHNDGAVRWLHGLGRLEHGADGAPVMMLGTIQDVTERRRSEERIRLAAAVFDNSREGVMVTDAQQRIVLVNRAFCELKGYDEQELLGQAPDMLQSGRHSDEFYAAMWESLKTTGHWQGEAWNRHRSGEVSPVLVNISSIHDNEGKITHHVGVFTDISIQKSTEARLEFMAHHDSLTQLPNRLLMHSRLEHSVEVARRENRRLALLMLDLDQFKDVNDSFGHLAGDELLQHVSKRLTGRMRGVDTVARLGGDEFAVLLDNPAHQEDALRIANDIIALLSDPWHLSNGVEVRIGVSIGISLYPEHGRNADALLQQADASLYRAKSEGRGCARFFTDDMTESARNRLQTESKLRRALKQNELRVYYQPQVDMASGMITGAEALLRWHDPERGMIPPCDFIPVAEETGLISEIGAWVLKETCRQGRTWIDAGLPPLTLSVNLSPHQFRFNDIWSTVGQILSETGFPAQRLELELTESALMAREGEVTERLERLREQGVRLAIDDFGTGYSSLAYLKLFPIDVLKVDKRFIDDIPHNEDDKAITAAIVAMAHTLGFEVTAEGVETPEQLAFLRTQGCDRYQGYLVSPAVPAEDFAALVSGKPQRNSRAG
ncbi:MAG: EAL domain-containing protein [Gammaproteobacteria bacterium]|nr:EAL domain-containing protein [Gammaproteobacteria bacterium]